MHYKSQLFRWSSTALIMSGLLASPANGEETNDVEEKRGVIPIIVGGASLLFGGAYIIDKESDEGSKGTGSTPITPSSTSGSKKSGGGNSKKSDPSPPPPPPPPPPSPKAGVLANSWVVCPEGTTELVFLGDAAASERTNACGQFFIANSNGRMTRISETEVRLFIGDTSGIADDDPASCTLGDIWKIIDSNCLVLESPDLSTRIIPGGGGIDPGCTLCTEFGNVPP